MVWNPTHPLDNAAVVSEPLRGNFAALDTALMAPLTALANNQVLLKAAGPGVTGVPLGANGLVLTMVAGVPTWVAPTAGALDLVESTTAGLPAPGTAGLLRHVTDTVRGVWMDTGTQWYPLNQNVLDVREFGAKCDDTTDDTAAIQAAIDVAGDTSSVRRSGLVVLIPGPSVITNTLLIRGKSITLMGRGWGFRLGSFDPLASWLRWNGPAGLPMIRLQDTQGGAVIRDLHLLGKSSARPSCGISFYETDDGRANVQNLVENVLIGAGPSEMDWETPGLDNGILFEGSSGGNNDSNLLRKVHIIAVADCGIRTNSRQHVGIGLDGVGIMGATYGVWNAGMILATSLTFYGCTGATLHFPELDAFGQQAYPQMQITDYIGEGSARLAEALGSCFLSIRGGYFQVTASLHPDGQVIKADNPGTHNITIESFRFTPGGAPPGAAPYVSIKCPPPAASLNYTTLRHVEWSAVMTGGPAGNGFDVASAGAPDQNYVEFLESTPALGSTIRAAENRLAAVGHQFDWDRRDFWQSVAFQAATPATITADQHNYAPSKATFWRLSADAPRTITGLGGGADGRVLWIANVGTHPLTFAYESAASGAANRVWPTTLATYTLPASTIVQLLYDATLSRWRLLVSGATWPLLPPGDTTADIGSAALQVRDLFLGGTLRMAADTVSVTTFDAALNRGLDLIDARGGRLRLNSIAADQSTLLLTTNSAANLNATIYSWGAALQTNLPLFIAGTNSVYFAVGSNSGKNSAVLTDNVASHQLTLEVSATSNMTVPNLAAAPTAPAAGFTALYAKTDKKLYAKDDAGLETALGGGGVTYPLLAPDGTAAAPSYSFASQPNFGFYLSGGFQFSMYSTPVLLISAGADGRGLINTDRYMMTAQTAPVTPPAGSGVLYMKSDKKFYQKDDAGLEFQLITNRQVTVTYSASMTLDAATGNHFIITANNATAFTINAPTNPVTGQEITITIRNTHTSALGTITWNAVFKKGTFTSGATATSRSIAFRYNGTNWVETVKSAADVPN